MNRSSAAAKAATFPVATACRRREPASTIRAVPAPQPSTRAVRLPSGRVLTLPTALTGADIARAVRTVAADANPFTLAFALAASVGTVDGERFPPDMAGFSSDDALAVALAVYT